MVQNKYFRKRIKLLKKVASQTSGKKISSRQSETKCNPHHIPPAAAAAAAAAKSFQSCPTLCDPIEGSQPGSPVPGILQARTLEWVAISFSNAWKWKAKSGVAQSCLTLSSPMDCSLPGSSIHGIFQARVLEWGAIAFSRDKFLKPLNFIFIENTF